MRRSVVVLVAFGCGPQIAVPGGETGTTNAGESTAATSGAIQISRSTGTLGEQTFVVRGRPVELETFYIHVAWAPWQSDVVEPWACLTGNPDDVLVGEAQL